MFPELQKCLEKEESYVQIVLHEILYLVAPYYKLELCIQPPTG